MNDTNALAVRLDNDEQVALATAVIMASPYQVEQHLRPGAQAVLDNAITDELFAWMLEAKRRLALLKRAAAEGGAVSCRRVETPAGVQFAFARATDEGEQPVVIETALDRPPAGAISGGEDASRQGHPYQTSQKSHQ